MERMVLLLLHLQALDFPLLINDGGTTLEHDLGVKSKLHQQQIIRAIKWVMLGLGEVADKPQARRASKHCRDNEDE
jgi:hypothetical protein